MKLSSKKQPKGNMNYIQRRMTMVFNEWVRRYAADPDSFADILDDKGKPIKDYGKRCTLYFEKIADELDAKGKLPKPPKA